MIGQVNQNWIVHQKKPSRENRQARAWGKLLKIVHIYVTYAHKSIINMPITLNITIIRKSNIPYKNMGPRREKTLRKGNMWMSRRLIKSCPTESSGKCTRRPQWGATEHSLEWLTLPSAGRKCGAPGTFLVECKVI